MIKKNEKKVGSCKWIFECAEAQRKQICFWVESCRSYPNWRGTVEFALYNALGNAGGLSEMGIRADSTVEVTVTKVRRDICDASGQRIAKGNVDERD